VNYSEKENSLKIEKLILISGLIDLSGELKI